MSEYTEEHAKSGLEKTLPEIECWSNQFEKYEISIVIPEFTSICPRTGLPDFGTITIRYMPSESCVELKSLKTYISAYRSLGIFYENAVNRILNDFVRFCRPVWAEVKGEFTPRGGMHSSVAVRYPREST